MGDTRHKVGDVDPAGAKRLRDAINGVPTAPVKPAKVNAPAPKAVDASGTGGRSRSANIDSQVDAMVNGDLAKMHKNQHADQ